MCFAPVPVVPAVLGLFREPLRKSQSRSNIHIMTIETLTYLGLALVIGYAIGHARGAGKC